MRGAELQSGMAANELTSNLKVESLCLVKSEKVSCYFFWQVSIFINPLWQSKTVVAVIRLVLSQRLFFIILKCKRERCPFTCLEALVVRYLKLIKELWRCDSNSDLNRVVSVSLLMHARSEVF